MYTRIFKYKPTIIEVEWKSRRKHGKYSVQIML